MIRRFIKRRSSAEAEGKGAGIEELLGILGQHNRSTQQLKFEVVKKQQTVCKFVQQCCFFQSEARTNSLTLQIRQTILLILQTPSTFPKKRSTN